MSEKLLIEIEVTNDRIEDALPALVYLANDLVENGTIEISGEPNWQQKGGFGYDLKWRWAEDEVQIPFEINDLWELEHELTQLLGQSAKHQSRTLSSFLKYLREDLSQHTTELFEEAA